MERDKEQTRLYEDILKYIEYKKANGVKYADAIEEVNDIVKHVKTSIDKVLNEVCCICGEELKDFGNNPYPISFVVALKDTEQRHINKSAREGHTNANI